MITKGNCKVDMNFLTNKVDKSVDSLSNASRLSPRSRCFVSKIAKT